LLSDELGISGRRFGQCEFVLAARAGLAVRDHVTVGGMPQPLPAAAIRAALSGQPPGDRQLYDIACGGLVAVWCPPPRRGNNDR
jgi:hypothetical protein